MGKMSQNLPSAAVVIGALWVRIAFILALQFLITYLGSRHGLIVKQKRNEDEKNVNSYLPVVISFI